MIYMKVKITFVKKREMKKNVSGIKRKKVKVRKNSDRCGNYIMALLLRPRKMEVIFLPKKCVTWHSSN